MTDSVGVLYVVATPIGNLGDMTPRAVEVLAAVALIAAEDTRHSAPLMHHFGVATPLTALHEHNERKVCERLIERLGRGDSIALISDAGTPLVSDPGFVLVREARARGIAVVPVPGASAAIAALSVAGLPSDRFVFEGFLPAKPAARRTRLEALRGEPRTLLFYESSHRVESSLGDMATVLGADRRALVARELTKLHETCRGGSLDELRAFVAADPHQRKGEFVVVVHGAAEEGEGGLGSEGERVLSILLEELPVKQAAVLAARITGDRKRLLYERALELRGA
ncbi:16S rRNA (cytidine(1402)-2'-O)-methyltransferase [Endothiovibrio diazotrophicus]